MDGGTQKLAREEEIVERVERHVDDGHSRHGARGNAQAKHAGDQERAQDERGAGGGNRGRVQEARAHYGQIATRDQAQQREFEETVRRARTVAGQAAHGSNSNSQARTHLALCYNH